MDVAAADAALANAPEDPTLTQLMHENFGPSADPAATDDRRIERGLDAVDTLSSPSEAASGVVWLHEEMAAKQSDALAETRCCFTCGKPNPPASCAKCGVAAYCGRDCQMADWKKGRWGGHKAQCAAYKCLGKEQKFADDAARRAAVEKLLASIRLYLCPFALAHGSGAARKKKAPPKARGCCFVQLGCTLSQAALPAPRDCAGVALPEGERALLLHFVSLAEFESDVAPSDAAIARAQPAVAQAVKSHDDQTEVVVLVRAACGTTAVLTQPLVPERRVCLQLASEYEARDCLQIDLDDNPADVS